MQAAEERRRVLEEKKAKLAEMKRARDERMAAANQPQKLPSRGPTPLGPRKQEVDDLVTSLLGDKSAGGSRPSSSLSGSFPAASTSRVPQPVGRPSVIPSLRTSVSVGTGDSAEQVVRSSQSEFSERDGRYTPVREIEMVDAQTELYEVNTKPVYITYSRGIQTQPLDEHASDTETDPDRRDRQSGRETEDELRKRLEAEFEVERERLEREIRAEEEAKRIDENKVVELSDAEKTNLLNAPEFAKFLEDSGKVMQRALNDAYDYTKDYTIGFGEIDDAEDAQRIRLVCDFYHERWTSNRSVTAVDWSSKFPELSAAAYNKDPKAVNDPDGLVAVWNLHMTDRPEFLFHSQSDVLSLTFSPFHPNLICGGTYAGQILLWDTRAKQLPVAKTPLAAGGHTYPVYSMKVVGTQNAHHIMTGGTDGTVCSWLPEVMAQPQESLELIHQGHHKTNEIAVTCMDFPDNETSTFFVGTEEGGVYQANRYDRAGAKAGLNHRDSYRGHTGPVTSLDFHPLHGAVDFSDLFLTTSVDWTVKLWRAKAGNKASGGVTTMNSGPSTITPLYSFEESSDYVFDAKWHPKHPAVFGTVDGTGKFDLWNLNNDIEAPTSKVAVGTSKAINKLAWDRKDGKRVALGSSDGHLYVYDVGEMAVPRDAEWAEMQKTVQTIMQTSAITTNPLQGRDGRSR